MENGTFVMISSTYDFITENDLHNILIKKIMIDYLSCIAEQFKKYFLSELNTELLLDATLIPCRNGTSETSSIKCPRYKS